MHGLPNRQQIISIRNSRVRFGSTNESAFWGAGGRDAFRPLRCRGVFGSAPRLCSARYYFVGLHGRSRRCSVFRAILARVVLTRNDFLSRYAGRGCLGGLCREYILCFHDVALSRQRLRGSAKAAVLISASVGSAEFVENKTKRGTRYVFPKASFAAGKT